MEKPSPKVWKDEMLAILASVSHPQELKRRCFACFSCCTLIILKDMFRYLFRLDAVHLCFHCFLFHKFGQQNSDTKVAPSALGEERSNVEGVSNVDVVPFFAASSLCEMERWFGWRWMEMDGEME